MGFTGILQPSIFGFGYFSISISNDFYFVVGHATKQNLLATSVNFNNKIDNNLLGKPDVGNIAAFEKES